MQIEQWVDLENYEGKYMISDFGRIKIPERISRRKDLKDQHVIPEKILKPKTTKCGYKSITLYINSTPKSYLLHRLIAKQFIVNVNNLPQINHKDGDKTNNHISNLEWVTASINMQYAFDTKLKHGYSGEKNPMSKYSNEFITNIWNDIQDNILCGAQIADKYKVNRVLVSEIKHGKKWANLTKVLSNK